jgi:hypothetical protein
MPYKPPYTLTSRISEKLTKLEYNAEYINTQKLRTENELTRVERDFIEHIDAVAKSLKRENK